jgi:hypothetical protein
MDTNASDLNAVLRVIDFLADPISYRAKIAELLEASGTAQAKIDEAQAASAALDEKKANHDKQIATERTAHQSQLEEDRRQFTARCNERETAFKVREATVAAAEKKLATERQEVADLRSDLEARIRAINSAVDSRPFPRAMPA